MLFRSQHFSVYFSLMALLFLAACGKQGQKLTPLQKAEATTKEFAEKYKVEIDIVNKNDDDDKKN